jgi:carbonic anhydrase
MRASFTLLIVMVIILAGVPAGAGAGAPATVGPVIPLPLQDIGGWNALWSGLAGPGISFDTVPASAAPTATESPLVDQLLLGNQEFRENVFNASPERYAELAAAQYPGILWIGCSDSRADPERITNSPPGELFVTRNVGNIVPNHDWNLAAVLEYSINYLEVKEIVVVGHSDCGAMKALDYDLHDPYIPLWLNDAREAKIRVDARIPPPKTPEEMRERARQIELENVRLQIEHLMTYPSVRNAVDEGRIQVHGLYYDLATGTLSRVT